MGERGKSSEVFIHWFSLSSDVDMLISRFPYVIKWNVCFKTNFGEEIPV